MKHPVVIGGETPLVQIEVDGELRWREAYVDATAGMLGRVKPETRENEMLVETIDGQMMIVPVPRSHQPIGGGREMTWHDLFDGGDLP